MSVITDHQLYAENQRRILLRNLLVVQFAVIVTYLLLAYILEVHVSPLIFEIGVGGTLVSMFTYHRGWIAFTRDFSFLFITVAIFLLVSSESRETGLYLHFVSVCSAALAAYSYDQRWKLFAVTIGSVLLFMFILFFEPQIVPFRAFEPREIKIFMVVNIFSMSVVCMICAYFLLRLNHRSERILQDSNLIIEQQNQELRKSNAELDRFVYSVSHDLRAPLSSIAGLLNLMDRQEERNNPQYLGLMRDRVQAMDKFIHEIISYSRNARTEVVKEPVLLRPMVEETIASLKYLPHVEKVQFEYAFPDNLELVVDKFRFKIILNNLLTNSIKYADFSRTKPVIQLEATRGNDFCRIAVIDNGIGIPMEFQNRVFDMFFRATESHQGSGLGLYIVKEAVEKMNGQVELNSRSRVGTTITVTWPI
ncbi:MAG: HAMP domain-containing histidine kinase [Cyclobacteriaceae bacterium]|nr:HAMP domain-containing histidine kinase [Cyclobacteriaceae bacterium]